LLEIELVPTFTSLKPPALILDPYPVRTIAAVARQLGVSRSWASREPNGPGHAHSYCAIR
jgi:hypothetical protein